MVKTMFTEVTPRFAPKKRAPGSPVRSNVLRMNAFDPIFWARQLLRGKAKQVSEIWRVEDFVADYVPVVDTYVDGAYGEGVSLFAFA